MSYSDNQPLELHDLTHYQVESLDFINALRTGSDSTLKMAARTARGREYDAIIHELMRRIGAVPFCQTGKNYEKIR